MKNIGILGLGYVGVVNVACFSKLGYTVYCNDVKLQKVKILQSGKCPIKEPEVDELIAIGVSNGTIIPVENAVTLIEKSDIIISCVGTPSKITGEVNLDYLTNVSIEMSNCIQNETKCIVFRSTVPPGTTEKIVNSYFSNNKNTSVYFFPEFLREATAVSDFFNYDRFVLGSNNRENVKDLIDVLHVNKSSKQFLTDFKTAEFAKYVDNSFHALKVVYANEIFGLGSDLGINVEIAKNIFIEDKKLNISDLYFKPGLPYGGSCLPKDLREIQFLIRQSNRNFNLLENIALSNENLIKFITNKIIEVDCKKIAFIGFSFKNYSDDIRESPMLKIFNQISNDPDYSICIYDEDLNIDIIRFEQAYLYKHIKEFDYCIENSELLIVSKRYLFDVINKKGREQIVLNLATNDKDVKNNIISLY